MTKSQKAIWKKLCSDLLGVRVITSIDWAAVERYVVCFDRWRQIEAVIKEMTAGSEKIIEILGSARRAAIKAAWQESARLNDELRHTEMQFGLTPAARSRVKTTGDGGAESEEDEEARKVIGL